jgi:RNA polymerase sigma factor (sigma-70 family)
MVHSPEITDSRIVDLMQKVKHLDAEAWADLVTMGSPWIYGWCRGAGVEPPEAGDIVQEVFAGVSRAIGNFRREITVERVREWWWSVTRNKIKGYYQRTCDEATAEQRTSALPNSPPADETGSAAAYLQEPELDAALARILEIGRDEITSRHPRKRGQ